MDIASVIAAVAFIVIMLSSMIMIIRTARQPSHAAATEVR